MDTWTGYYPIADYGFIGDMHTCALVSKNGYLDFMYWPAFDSRPYSATFWTRRKAAIS